MAPNAHLGDHRAVAVETILSLVTTIALHTARLGTDRRGHIDAHLGAITSRILLVANLELVTHREVDTLGQRRVVLLATEEEVGNVVSMVGVGVLHTGQIGVTGEYHVTRQIAARHVKPQPSAGVTHGQTVGHTLVEQLDIVAAVGLIVIQQIGTVDLDPRFQRYGLGLLK